MQTTDFTDNTDKDKQAMRLTLKTILPSVIVQQGRVAAFARTRVGYANPAFWRTRLQLNPARRFSMNFSLSVLSV